MKSAIVTGANGFVGSALLRELTGHGIRVIAVIKDEQETVSHIEKLPGVEIVYCEMNEMLEQLPAKVADGADVFYHLAWAGSTGAARGDYNLQLQNAKWTLDAVSAAHKIGCRRFVGAGTLAQHDVHAYTPQNGSTPNAVSCYGAAKITAHYMSKAECSRLGMEHVWAYLSNTYGIGNYTSNFINFASKVMITGKDANFTSGEQLYDFVYIDDIAQGLYCMGNRGKNNHAYYIGSTNPRQLKEFIIRLRDIIDPGIELHLGRVPFNGIAQPASTYDCTPLVEDTGYCPHVPFEEGIRKTVEWLRIQIEDGNI